MQNQLQSAREEVSSVFSNIQQQALSFKEQFNEVGISACRVNCWISDHSPLISCVTSRFAPNKADCTKTVLSYRLAGIRSVVAIMFLDLVKFGISINIHG